jgi:hypothetical protein
MNGAKGIEELVPHVISTAPAIITKRIANKKSSLKAAFCVMIGSSMCDRERPVSFPRRWAGCQRNWDRFVYFVCLKFLLADAALFASALLASGGHVG